MSLVYVFAASKMEGQPVEQIAGARNSQTLSTGETFVRAGANDLVLITGGMGPKCARAKVTEVLGLARSQTVFSTENLMPSS